MKRTQIIAVLAVLTLFAAGRASGQTVVRPGFNIFSIEQDVEIGKQSAAQVEKQLPMLSDAAVSRYVTNLGARLAAQAPGTKFTYKFRVAPNGSPFGETPLEEATSDLIRHILQANPNLERVNGSESRGTVSGHPTLSVRLESNSSNTGTGERVTVFTRQLPDEHVVYMLLIAPASEYALLQPTFDRMTGSLRTDGHATHN